MEENCDDKSINTNTRPSLSRMSSEKEDEINRYLSDNNEDDDLYLEEEPSFLVSPQITHRTKARKSTNKKKKKSSQVLTDALLLDTSHISLGLHSVNSSPEASDASVSESEKHVAVDVNVDEADAETKADGLLEEASSPYVFKSKRYSSLGSNSNSGRLSGDEDTDQSQRRKRSSSIASASSMKSSSDNDLEEEVKQTSDSTIATTTKNESAVRRGSFSKGSPLKMLLNSTSSLPKGAALKNLMASPPLKSVSMNLLQRRLSGSGASGTGTINNEKNNNSVRTALMKTPERKRSLSFGSSSSTTGLDSSPSYKQFFQSLLNLNKENNNNIGEQQQPKKQKGNKSNSNDKDTDAHPATNRDSLSVSTTVSGEGMTNTDNANTPKNFKEFMEKSYSPIMTFYSGSEGGGSSRHSLMMSQDTQTTNTSDGLLAGEHILMMSQEETEQNQLNGESEEQDKGQLNNDIVKEKRSKIPSLGPSSQQEQQTTKRRSNIQPPSASTMKKTRLTKKDLTVETQNLDAFIGNLNKTTMENNKEEKQQEPLRHSPNKADIGNDLDDMTSPEMMELSEESLPPNSQLSETTNDQSDEKMHESPTDKNIKKDDRGEDVNNDLPQHSVVTGLAEEHQEKRESVEPSVSISHKNFSLEDLQNVQNFVNASSHSLKEKLQHSSYLRRQKLLSLSSIDTTNSSDGDANSNNVQQQLQNNKRRSSLESFSMYNEENDYYDIPKKKKSTNQQEKKKPLLSNNKHYSSKRPTSITTLTTTKNETTTTTTLAPVSNTNKSSSTPKSSMMVMGIGGTEGVPKIAKRPPTIPISPKLGIRKSRSPSKAMKKIKKEFVQSKKLLESISRENNKQHYLSSPQIKCPPRSIIPRPPANLTPEENPYKPFKARPILHHLPTKQTKKRVINSNSKSTGVKKQGVYKPFEARPLPSSSFSSRGNVSKHSSATTTKKTTTVSSKIKKSIKKSPYKQKQNQKQQRKQQQNIIMGRFSLENSPFSSNNRRSSVGSFASETSSPLIGMDYLNSSGDLQQQHQQQQQLQIEGDFSVLGGENIENELPSGGEVVDGYGSDSQLGLLDRHHGVLADKTNKTSNIPNTTNNKQNKRRSSLNKGYSSDSGSSMDASKKVSSSTKRTRLSSSSTSKSSSKKIIQDIRSRRVQMKNIRDSLDG